MSEVKIQEPYIGKFLDLEQNMNRKFAPLSKWINIYKVSQTWKTLHTFMQSLSEFCAQNLGKFNKKIKTDNCTTVLKLFVYGQSVPGWTFHYEIAGAFLVLSYILSVGGDRICMQNCIGMVSFVWKVKQWAEALPANSFCSHFPRFCPVGL